MVGKEHFERFKELKKHYRGQKDEDTPIYLRSFMHYLLDKDFTWEEAMAIIHELDDANFGILGE